jgi:putative membrane protein insertion efficiency factor
MRNIVVVMLGGYKRWISPWLPPVCRFEPTCSDYMAQAIERQGTTRGVWLGLKRLLRCNPFCAGGVDPVP